MLVDLVAGNVGRCHAAIWWQHDSKQYRALQNSALNLFLGLGYSKKRAEKASQLVKQVYSNYDLAVSSKDHKSKEEYFEKMKRIIARVPLTLGHDLNPYKDYAAWIIWFSYRNYAVSLLFLALYHIKSVSLSKWPSIVVPFYFLFQAGYSGHNRRNRQVAEKYLAKYWSELGRLGLEKKMVVY